MVVELAFPILVHPGQQIPLDHGYSLYGSLCRILKEHLPSNIAIMPIRGAKVGDRLLIGANARLRIRLEAESIGQALPLAGQYLDLNGSELGLGVPEVRGLTPAARLWSAITTIKGYKEPAPFLEAAQRQLSELGINGVLYIPTIPLGPRSGEPLRRVVRIKDKIVVGFSLTIDGLSPADSLKLLEQGLGGRRHMGCGIFLAVSQDKRA